MTIDVPFSLALLGPVALTTADGTALPEGARSLALLAALALGAPDIVAADTLIDAVWQDDPGAAGRNRLQVAVSKLRKVLPPGTILSEAPGYRLDRRMLGTDVDEFQRLRTAARDSDDAQAAVGTLVRALALVRGEPLANLGASPLVDRSASALAELILGAREELLDAQSLTGNSGQVIVSAEALLREHPLRERVWARYVLALYRSARQADALAALRQVRRLLSDELGIDPGRELAALEAAVLRQDAALDAAPSAIAPLADASGKEPTAASDEDRVAGPDRTAARSRVRNLPSRPTPLIGRARALAELVGLISRHRLVTVVGFGGMGKTRLATAAAIEVVDLSFDEVCFVDLSSVTEGNRTAGAITAALAVGEKIDGAADDLVAACGDRRMLLVLDNVEQLLPDAAAVVERVLAECPHVHILATSREPLRLRVEQLFGLTPLAVPDKSERTVWTDDEIALLARVPAVALFLDRVAAVRPEWVLTAADAGAVSALCRRLDGLPLAVELAAARLRVLSPQALLPRLDRALAVLSGGTHDLPARHRTLRATILASFEGLAPAEQRFLETLSVFPGSFALEAAEAMCRPIDGEPLDLIAALVDRSLLRHLVDERGPGDRYALLTPIRQFAAERLQEAGAAGPAADAHARHYMRAAALPAAWTRADQSERDRRVLPDWHNHRSALDRLLEVGDRIDAMRLAVSVRPALVHAGRYGDARAVIDDAMRELPAIATDPVHVLLPLALEQMAREASQVAPARAAASSAVRAARELGEPSLLATALATAALRVESTTEAHRLLAEAEALLDAPQLPGAAIPRWFVTERWGAAAVMRDFVGPDRAEAIELALMAGASGAEFCRLQYNRAVSLFDRGRYIEAMAEVDRYERADAGEDATALIRVAATALAAETRIALGDADLARADLDLCERRLEQVNMPGLAAEVPYLQAVADRLLGDRAGAERRLMALLGAIPAETGPAHRASALWLLAVLSRERHQGLDASETGGEALLQRAWSAAIDSGSTDLLERCVLERALQLVDRAPASSAALIGAARRADLDPVSHHGVRYETSAVLDGLRARVGDAAVERILLDARGRTLTDAMAASGGGMGVRTPAQRHVSAT